MRIAGRSHRSSVSDLVGRTIRESGAVADLLHAIDWAIRCALLRDRGHEAVEELETLVLRSHQDHYFLRGLQKLGLREEASDAIRCAKYHCLSNAVGGLRTGFAVESPEKAWLFYWTPYYFDSPWTPGVGLATFRPEFMIRSMATWHANNGRLLDNPGLGFAVTHLVMRGDAFDAGYFYQANEDLRGNALRLAFGEDPGAGLSIERPKFGEEWPPIRRARAWRNFGNGYVGARLYWIAQLLGAGEAAPIVEHGLRIALLQKREALMEAFQIGGESERPTVEFFCHFLSVSGCAFDVRDEGRSTLVEVTRSRIHEVPEFDNAPIAPEVEVAVEAAWLSCLQLIDTSIDIDVFESPGRGGANWVWRFHSV